MNNLICVVEGAVDADVARVLAALTGYDSPTVYVKEGRMKVAQQVRNYQRASGRQPWFVLVDLDGDECPAKLLRQWGVAASTASFVCRIAVREIEAWLLADRARFARFLRISPDRIPLAPEALPDPKRFVVELAARSTSREIREDFAPSARGRRREGPAYSSRLSEFVRSQWRPDDARKNARSLDACITRLSEMRQAFSPLIVAVGATVHPAKVPA